MQVFGDVAMVPVIDHRVAASRDAWQDTGTAVYMDETAARGRRLLAAIVTGRCMTPEIEPGDVVIFDRNQREPQDGEAVVCTTTDGQLLVKRFYREDGAVVLIASDGTEVRPNGLIVEGIVISVQRRLARRPRG